MRMYYLWILLPSCYCAILQSSVIQPGNGVVKEVWHKVHEVRLDAHTEVRTYPNCPDLVENLDDFNDPPKYGDPELKNVLVRYKSYFIPPETGDYRFYIRCQDQCSVSIEENPSELRTVVKVTIKTTLCWDCHAVQTSRSIHLYKSLRYYIEVIRVGTGNNDFAALGVQLPSGSYERPINKSNLYRSMALYNWHGMVAEYYNIPNGTRPDLNNMTTEPTEVRCMTETLENRNRNNFAIRATGYFLPQISGIYQVYLQCQDHCAFYIKTNETEKRIAQNNNSTIGNIGTLIKGNQYKIEINFYKGDKGVATFYVKKANSSIYSFFSSMDTRAVIAESEIVPDPTYTVKNSTSIILHWNQTRLPVYSNFNFQSYYIRFWPPDNNSKIYEHTITDRNITSVIFANLGVWKIYQAQLWHVGKQYTLTSNLLVFRTGEGVPSTPPVWVGIRKHTATSMIVSWGSIPFQQRHGVLIGYAIQYKKKDENVWFTILSNQTGIREKIVPGLIQDAEYGFRVAGVTSTGAGVYSSIYYQRTLEDAPSAGPVGVSAHNLSSSALEVTWGEVPLEKRHGLIRMYIIYYKLKNAPEKDWAYTSTSASVNKTSIFGLKYWSIYNIRVAAKTTKEGVKSDAVFARTDEDVPSSAPLNITGKATGSQSIAINWTQIPYELTNGIITGYLIQYKEAEADGTWIRNSTTQMHADFTGLEEYFTYTFRVAGVTSKGIGAWSTEIYVRTNQDVPSAPPNGVKAAYTSATSLLASWQNVPYRHQNGIIIGYKVKYRENQTAQWHEVVVNDTNQQREIFNLKNYTWYEICVAAMTYIGVGNFSEPFRSRTGENVPSTPPTHFRGNNVTSKSIIVFWNSIPMKSQNGIIVGYIVQYIEARHKESVWMNRTYDRAADNGTIINLLIFEPYYLKIAGMTSKGVGTFSKEIKVWTEEDLPFGYPVTISGKPSSSTSFYLHWDSKLTNKTNGIILGYRVYYQIDKCPSDRPSWCAESDIHTARTKSNESHITLNGLKKFMEYNISIRAFNKIGAGPHSPMIKMKTAIDIPTAPPRMVETFSKDYNSISIFWDPIIESKRNGIIIMYRIFYRLQERDVLKTHRVVRSITTYTNRTVEGLQHGESYKDIHGSLYSATVHNLESFRWYIIRIGGLTRAGLGPTTVVNASCGQGVAVEAPLVQVHDKYSFYEISINWSKLQSFKESHGTILEYEVQYWAAEIEMQPMLEHKVMSLTVKAPQRSIKLLNLRPFTKYGIRLAAATQTGVGKFTNVHYGETCRCEKRINAVKRVLYPLITNQENDTFTKLVDSAITMCCSTCSSKQTSTYWTTDTGGEGIFSAEDVIKQLKLGIEVYAPQLQVVRTWDNSENSYGFGKFIPILKSPGITVLSKKPTPTEMANEGAKVLLKSLSRAYPILIISIIIVFLTGYLHWLNELNTSGSHFDDRIKHGLSQAIWFSFITTSAVGYGDLVPSKMLIGRLLATISMFFGVIWKVLLFSSLTVTFLAAFQENHRVFTLAGKTVMATNQTQLLALKKGATVIKVFNYSQQYEVINAVLNGEAELALVDGLSVINDQRIINHPQLEIKDVLYDNQYYGINLNGKTEKLSNCISMYMRTNKEEIEKNVGAHYDSIWKMMQTNGKLAKTSSIISKDARIYTMTIMVLMSLSSLAILVGLCYEKRRRKRQRMRVISEDLVMLHKTDESLISMVDEFVERITQKTEELDLEHAKQMIALSRKRYAINIVPDIIAIYGDADYEKDRENFRKSMELCTVSESGANMDKIMLEGIKHENVTENCCEQTPKEVREISI